MQFFNLIVLALAGSAVAAKDPNNAKCRQMARFERLEKLVTDDAKLNQRFKNDTSKINDFKKKVNDNKAKLAQLKADNNLVQVCAQKQAVRTSTMQCYQMIGMQRFEKMVNNQTTLDKITKNDKTKQDAMKKRVESNKAKLDPLQSNSTLTQFCAGVSTKNTCSRMNRLTKKVERDQKMVNNQTALDTRFNKDATRIDLFKARAAREQQKLNEMKNNATLVGACNTIAQQKKGTAPGTTQQQQQKGAAPAVQALGLSATLFAVAVAGFLSL